MHSGKLLLLGIAGQYIARLFIVQSNSLTSIACARPLDGHQVIPHSPSIHSDFTYYFKHLTYSQRGNDSRQKPIDARQWLTRETSHGQYIAAKS
jgi:hypothetical protein